MAFDPRIVEAKVALEMIGTTDMPRLAWDALEAGLDGPAIRRLAALNSPTHFQVNEVLPEAMREMGLTKLSRDAAALQLAKIKARAILQSKSDPLDHIRDFEYMWREAGYRSALAELGELEEEVYVARLGNRTDAEIRAWITDRLRAFAES